MNSSDNSRFRYNFPTCLFEDAQVDEAERFLEVPSMENVCIEHILWLATRVTAVRYLSRAFIFHDFIDLARLEIGNYVLVR